MAKEMMHFTDGEQIVCEAKGEKATVEELGVNCPDCLKIVYERAEEENDPYIAVRVFNRDLKDGVDFNFTWRRPAILSKPDVKGKVKVKKRFPMRHVRIISGAKHMLRRSDVEHLEKLAHPIKKYVEGAEEGKSMQMDGMRHRFAITKI